MKKFLILTFIPTLFIFSCKKSVDEPTLSRADGSSSISEIYSGYPKENLDCSNCANALSSVEYYLGALKFTDYNHFLKVRNCLSLQVEGVYNSAELAGLLTEEFDGEKPLDEFEIWYQGYKSLRKLNNELEANYIYNGSDGTDIPFISSISDPVEMSLISAEGKVWFGNELFDIDNNPYERSGGCRNLWQTSKIVYSGVGSYYFRMRNSIFPWPWGTTVYGTTVSLRKKSNGTFNQVVKRIGVQGAGLIYDEQCKESKQFVIFFSQLLKRRSVTRSFTDFGWSSGIKTKECLTAHHYENLTPLTMYVY